MFYLGMCVELWQDAVDEAAEASNVAVQFKQLPVVSHPGVVGAEVVEVVPLR